MLFKLLFLVTLFALCSTYCDIPPRFWCDTKAISKKCGVEVLCAERRWVDPDAVQPVRVEVFTESYCGPSIRFLYDRLYPTWQALSDTGIMNLTLYFYGGAHQTFDADTGLWNFTCMHGLEECQMNLFEAGLRLFCDDTGDEIGCCNARYAHALAMYDIVLEPGLSVYLARSITNCVQKYMNFDANKYMPVILCLEQTINDHTKDEITCMQQAGMDYEIMNKCASGPEGNQLMHDAGVVTESLQPKLYGTPWITVNGLTSHALRFEIMTGNFTQLVCDSYPGVKPSACKVGR